MSEVTFPIVGGGKTDLVCVSCACLSSDDYPAGKVLVLGQNDQDIEHILADARHEEPGGPEITIPIRVRFKPNHFSGKSYGLALAIADKCCRYRRNGDQDDACLLATGIVLAGGSGDIGSVSGIDDKLDAMAREAKAGDIIILPSADIELSDPAMRARLKRLASRNVTCHAIRHLNEIAYLWSEGAPAPAPILPEVPDERTEHAPPEIQKSPSVDDAGGKARGSKLAKLVITALLLLVVLSVSVLWFRSTGSSDPPVTSPPTAPSTTLPTSSPTAPEAVCDTAELQRNEDEAQGLLFSKPRDVPIEIAIGKGGDLDAADMLSSVRASVTEFFVEKKFMIVTADACAGVRLDIWVERDQQIRTIKAAMQWSRSGELVLQRSWMVEIDAHAEKKTIEESSADMADQILNSILWRLHKE